MKVLYLIYQLFIALPIMLAVTIIAAVVCIVGSVFDNRFWGYWPGAIWGRLFCIVFLIPVHVHGREHVHKGQSYVIAPNHQSYWDAFSMYGYVGINFKWIMKKEIGKIPFVGWACRMAGHIFIDRASKFKSMDSIRKAESQLKDGMSVLIFPEGTRTHDGKMGRFKRGAFQIAEELQLPILPVAIDGCYEVMNRHAWHVTWHPIHITFHEPVWPKSNGGTTEQELSDMMRETTAQVVAVIQETLDKGY
ncbi:MAG: 1-acyl-sn-glycerol-3-phosphate acyltransferase [Bacteroidaceae bacterium]|nr:1-acyl-sn-glycerol-3-phosphate acyltransferase [Candidatus Colenecus caballi]MCQ2071507.1 1-acyl-sn-glycerol-3-phosphate acyltransferase [Bacteroidaceae bacterium]